MNSTSTMLPDSVETKNRIELEDLSIFYGDFMAVEGVDLQVRPQSVMSFIGPSGCGKSLPELTYEVESCSMVRTSTHQMSTRCSSAE
jgi:ABC-type phosphate transport system ATPase subunit